MRLISIFLFLVGSFNAFACSDALRLYSHECQLQDRYLKIQENKNSFSANVDKSGVTFKSLKIELNDILKLHKNLFAQSNGLRTFSGVTNPKEEISCHSKLLNNESLSNLTASDLLSSEDYPLLEIENVQACPNKVNFSATIVYYKGASVKHELNRWIIDFNEMMNNYELEKEQDISPLQYIADMRRWFLAISPFDYGNLEVINALTDYTMRRLNLFSIPLMDLNKPHLLTIEKNRELIKDRTQKTITNLESNRF